jgi:4a-hydroxytetrahydrobiopterin dehydratase
MARSSPAIADDAFHSVGLHSIGPSRKEPYAVNDLIPLAQAHCIARRGSEHRLSEARVRELLPQIPGWEIVEDGHAIAKTFRFGNYHETMAFVNALAFVSHR